MQRMCLSRSRLSLPLLPFIVSLYQLALATEKHVSRSLLGCKIKIIPVRSESSTGIIMDAARYFRPTVTQDFSANSFSILRLESHLAIMVSVQHMIAPATLPLADLSILSYNVLLSNSQDGWWTYKMYLPPLQQQQDDAAIIADWEYRKTLIRDRIAMVDADVVCLQEVAPESYASDFDFMKELGYESEMFKKGRFRPATFWKRCELVDVAHKDRCLLTALRKNDQIWFILNCHLQTGKEGPRRLRQIHEGVKAVNTMAKKQQKATRQVEQQSVKLIVCGDFNGGSECGAIRFLEDGSIDEHFREDGNPVTSSRKELPLTHPLSDVALDVIDRPPPPTLVVPELIPLMVEGEAYDNPKLSNDMIVRLQRIYSRLAATKVNNSDDEHVMNVDDVENYLVTINKKLGRGSEFREAARQMGWKAEDASEQVENGTTPTISLPRDGILTLDGFVNIYQAELQQGKFWGIAHDLAVLGEPLPSMGVHKSRYDRIYYSSTTCHPMAVMDFLSDDPCPNKLEPSDHLPVAAAFRISKEA